MTRADIIQGDCREVMATMEAESVDTLLSDPPYGLSFMGKGWDHGVPGVEFWQAALRVAKPGAMLLAFGGTRTYHRLACAIEDAGWEIRDCMQWIYASGFPKSHDISKAIDKAAGAEREVVGKRRQRANNKATSSAPMNASVGEVEQITAPATDAAKTWNGWGTALKPAAEMICVAMKPLDGTFANNALKHGVAGLNVDGGRIGTDEELGRFNHARTSGSSYVIQKQDSLVDNSRGLGRWPSNVILDAEAGRMLDAQTGEEVSRFFYCPKATAERDEFNNHPTLKPVDLMRYLARLTATPTGGLVLDPFCGSGTTGVACIKERRDFVGIELSEEYADIARRRIEAAQDDEAGMLF